jgi:hypothetical protein
MRGVREITGAIFASLEIANGVLRALKAGLLDFLAFQQPDFVSTLMAAVSWSASIAFIAFAATAFRQFSYRWLRVIGAILSLLLLPVVPAVVLARSGYVFPIEWILRLPMILVIIAHLIKLGIAGFIYLWSVRREHGSLVAASADLAT